MGSEPEIVIIEQTQSPIGEEKQSPDELQKQLLELLEENQQNEVEQQPGRVSIWQGKLSKLLATATRSLVGQDA